MYAAVDNSVTLPAYAKLDGAFYFFPSGRLHLQVDFENLLNQQYILNADSNTNLSPGSPRRLHVGVATTF